MQRSFDVIITDSANPDQQYGPYRVDQETDSAMEGHVRAGFLSAGLDSGKADDAIADEYVRRARGLGITAYARALGYSSTYDMCVTLGAMPTLLAEIRVPEAE